MATPLQPGRRQIDIPAARENGVAPALAECIWITINRYVTRWRMVGRNAVSVKGDGLFRAPIVRCGPSSAV